MYDDQDLHHMNFGDLRLTDRLGKILQDLSEQPTSSIPQACQSAASTKAAYRFLSNDNVNAKKIREGFYQTTIDRIHEVASDKIILFTSDSTNLVYTSHKKLKGIGVLRNQKARGLNLHTTLVSTESEVTLGVVDQQCWGRKPEDYGKSKQRSGKPIEEKESYRWIESLRAAQNSLPDTMRGIFMGDRGADIYELFVEPRTENMHLIIRAMHNRAVNGSSKRAFEQLEQTLSNNNIIEIKVNRSGERKERIAKLAIHYKNLIINPPNGKKNLSPININAVLAKEIVENADIEDPIYWVLFTTLSITSIEKAFYVVKTYAKRWLIERYHYVLKQGCKIQELQLENADRIDKAVAVYTIVACRIMHITYLARICPDEPCTKIFDDDEWRALYCYVNKTAIEPDEPMTLAESVMMLAKVGGFLGRKRDGPPGVKVIWRGMCLLDGIVEMYRILKRKNMRLRHRNE